MKKAKRPIDECTVPSCERKRAVNSDLVCPPHWALVPRRLKTALWTAQTLRSLKAREWETILAASSIVDYLEAKKVLLPPEVKLASAGSMIERTDELEIPSDSKRIITSSR